MSSTVTSVTNTFLSLVGEPDAAFLTDALTQSIMGNAYELFRNYVTRIVPNYYAVRVTINPSGSQRYSLQSGPVIISGSGTLTGPRLLNILEITNYSDYLPLFTLSKATTVNTLQGYSYMYENGYIYFGLAMAQNLTLLYHPVSSVDWSSGTYIDDLESYHYLIALYAVKEYCIIRGSGYTKEFEGALEQISVWEDRLAEQLTRYSAGNVQEVINGYR